MEITKKELAQKISILYYEKNKSQNEIAKEMGISRSYVSQLLNYARENGIVKITINVDEYELRMIRKEIEFKSKFPSLKQVYIMSSESDDFTDMNIAKFAVPYVADLISEANVIGINLGRSVERMINLLKERSFVDTEDKKVVQMMGGFSFSQVKDTAHPNELVKMLSDTLNCQGYYLNSPVIIEDYILRESLLKEKSIHSVISMWDEIDLTIMGIGVPNQKSKLFDLLSSEMKEMIEKYDARGELTVNFFDENGAYLPLMENYKIGISLDLLKKVPVKVVICNGEYKKEALLAALKGGLIDVLITDSITVDAVEKII